MAMRISNISPVGTLTPPRADERDNSRPERQRFRFSTAHIIVDLSFEAMRQLGQEPKSMLREPRPPLFVYNGSGAFIYDEPAPVKWTIHSEAAPQPVIEELSEQEELAALNDVPVPSIVSFDGRLRNPARL
jgi:hypothetical protein